ncbi:MAG: hypothetical protein AAF635_03405 [Cyanobacteria bacterium P01_C01_bin.69]
MVSFPSQASELLFNEIAIADLNQFQIAVLTTTRQTSKRIFSATVPVPERVYQHQGWLIYDQKIVAHFDNLKVGLVFPKSSPFKVSPRIAPAIPIAFEVRSAQRLPLEVCAKAALVCELPKANFPHHSVFRQILPRFVKVYAYQVNGSLLDQVETMLAAMDLFISQNYERLKRVPFYREQFGL